MTTLGSQNYIFAQKVTKMGSIIGHRIDSVRDGPLEKLLGWRGIFEPQESIAKETNNS